MARPTSRPGFGRVRLNKRGNYYYARFMDGRRREVALRVTNKVTAEEKARKINDALENGQPWEWVVGGRATGEKTFSEVTDEFLEKGCNWGPSTRKSNAGTVRMLVQEFGPKPAASIDKVAIEAYLARRRDEGLKVSSRNRYLCALKVILGKAHEWGYLPTNPAAGIKVISEGHKLPRPYWKDEIKRLSAQLQPHHRRVFELYLETGLRRGELVNLRWGDVDFADSVLTIRQPKNQRDRIVPMSRRVREVLRTRRREWEVECQGKVSDLRVFGPAADIRQVLERAARRAGIEKGRRDRLQHRLRDTFITHMVEEGVPLDRVQLLAGHNSIEMTRRYAETKPESLKQAIAQVFDTSTARTP